MHRALALGRRPHSDALGWANARRLCSVLIVVVSAAGCGGSDTPDTTSPTTGPALAVPENATFCSVFDDQYAAALAAAVPATDSAFEQQSELIVAWAEVLRDLASDEVALLAGDNVAYHQAQADLRSAADFIPGSNEMHAWARSNC